MFKKKGLIVLDKGPTPEDKIMEIALDAGAEDVRDADSLWEIETDPSAFDAVKDAFTKAGLAVSSSELTLLPQNRVHLDGSKAESMLKLMSGLEDFDDVQNVYA